MTGILFLIFAVVFSVMMISIGIGLRLLEAERKKRVQTVLQTATAAAAAPHATALIQTVKAGEPQWLEILARLNVVRRIENTLQQSGLGWNLPKLLALTALFALAGIVVSLKLHVLINPVLSAAALGCGLGALPMTFVHIKRKRRMAEIEEQFPEALDFLARAIRAGHALQVSLEMLGSESPEPLRSEFARVYNEQNLGETLPVVLRHLIERVPLLDVKFFVSAVLMQRETGGNLGEILTRLAHVIRDRFRLKGQVRAVSAHGRITALVLTVLPFITALGLYLSAPDYVAETMREPESKYLVLGAFVFLILGFISMRKIINIKV